MLKKYLKNVIVYVIFVLLILGITSYTTQLSDDIIWNFGFSYNIANGLIPYRDFNMIVGPYYNLICGLFMSILGNQMIIFRIINTMIISLFMVQIFYKLKWKIIFLLLFIPFIQTFYSYNTFVAFLTLGILLLLDLKDINPKKSNFLIGILIGIIMMTKHNIGIIFIMIYLYHSRNKLLSLFSCSLPIIYLFIY